MNRKQRRQLEKKQRKEEVFKKKNVPEDKYERLFDTANQHLINNNYSKAIEIFKEVAKSKKYNREIFNIAEKYFDENTNGKLAIELFKLVEDDIWVASSSIGVIYYDGIGNVPRDIAKSMEYFKKVVSSKHEQFLLNNGLLKEIDIEDSFQYKSYIDDNVKFIWCLFIIAWMYYYGLGSKQDISKALEYAQKALKYGCLEALQLIGKCYLSKKSNTYNLGEAVKYLKKSIECGDYSSAYILGYEYLIGNNLDRDLAKAKEYLEIANKHEINCEFALELINDELNPLRGDNPIILFAKDVISKNLTDKQIVNSIYLELDKKLSKCLNNFDVETKQLFMTGIFTYIKFKSLGYEIYKDLDFSAVIVPLIKGLEREIGKVFFINYKNFLDYMGIPAREIGEKKNLTIYDKTLGKYRYLDNIKRSDFTLGSFKYITGANRVLKVDKDYIESEYNKCNRKCKISNIDSVYKDKNFMIDKPIIYYICNILKDTHMINDIDVFLSEIDAFLIKISAEIADITYNYRNPAAHTEIISESNAATCINYLIEGRNLVNSIFSKIDYDKIKNIEDEIIISKGIDYMAILNDDSI